MTHPYAFEADPPSTDGERAQHLHDERRDLAPAGLHLVPPLATWDIHAKLMAEITKTTDRCNRIGRFFDDGRLDGLRAAYCIVFGEDAP